MSNDAVSNIIRSYKDQCCEMCVHFIPFCYCVVARIVSPHVSLLYILSSACLRVWVPTGVSVDICNALLHARYVYTQNCSVSVSHQRPGMLGRRDVRCGGEFYVHLHCFHRNRMWGLFVGIRCCFVVAWGF